MNIFPDVLRDNMYISNNAILKSLKLQYKTTRIIVIPIDVHLFVQIMICVCVSFFLIMIQTEK